MIGNASPMDVAALLTAFAIIFYALLGITTVLARRERQQRGGKGHVLLDRHHRLQMGTLQYLLFFIATVWLFAWSFPQPSWLALMGAVWLIGRTLYSLDRWVSSGRPFIHNMRGVGSVLSLLAISMLTMGAAYGIVAKNMTDKETVTGQLSNIQPATFP